MQCLGATISEQHKLLESYKVSERSRGQDVWGVPEVPWFVQPRAEEAEGMPYGGCSSSQGAEGQC